MAWRAKPPGLEYARLRSEFLHSYPPGRRLPPVTGIPTLLALPRRVHTPSLPQDSAA